MTMVEHLSEDYIVSIKEAFAFFDKDNDGALSTKDIGTVMRSIGGNPTDAQVQALLQRVIGKGVSSVRLSDFIVMMDVHKSESFDTEEEIREAFRVFDKEGKGYISAAELRHVMTNLGEKLSDEEVEEMISAVDSNGDGRVDYEALVSVILSCN